MFPLNFSLKQNHWQQVKKDTVALGKSWACKHWKFQNNYFVIFLHFCCIFLHLGLSFWICVVIFCHFLSFLCHFIVILLSFWERENEEKNVKKWLPWQTFCYLVAAPNTRNKWRNSWKASRRWRRIGQGSLPWGIRFWACLDEELSPGSGCRAGSKTGWGGGAGVKWPGGAAPAREAGPTWKLQKRNFTSTRVFLHFLDRVCHLHRLPDSYEKTTRKWTMLESRKRQENDKKMTRKWQKMT